MDPFSTATAGVALIASCVKLGQYLVDKYDAYKNAEQEIAETLLKLTVLWDKTKTQMDLLAEIWDSLEASHQLNQHMLLNMLATKLQTATRLLDEATAESETEASNLPKLLKKRGKLHKGRYVMSLRENLRYTVDEFRDWHSLFDPSWYLIAKVTSANLDQYLDANKFSKQNPHHFLKSLRKSILHIKQVKQSSKEIRTTDFVISKHPIHFSSAMTAQFEDNNSPAIVDCMTPNPFADMDATTKDVKALSRALSLMDPFTFGLLRCPGVVNKSKQEENGQVIQFELVFEVPKGLSDPHSLRNLLRYPQPSLNLRLSISRQLATSILYLYTVGFVHKNIRPETILLLSRENSDQKLTFLVGFECFRMSDTATNMFGDRVMEREIYRHPSRQGDKPKEMYRLEHDVYSLGVCLLELGLWISFVQQNTHEGGFIPGEKLEQIKSLKDDGDERERASSVKKKFVALAEEQLPSHMGQKFANVVIDCLTCLDINGQWARMGISDSDEIDTGIQFIENVLTELQEIVV